MATYRQKTLKDGTLRHQYYVRRRGAPHRVFTAPTKVLKTKTAARQAARAYEAEIDAGRARGGRETVGDCIALYLDSDAFHKLTDPDKRRRHVEWWAERLEALPLADLRGVQRAVQAGKVELRTRGGLGGQPVDEPTVNRYLAALGRVFREAERDADLGAALLFNPARKVGRFDETGRQRDRVFTDEEFRGLLHACRETGDPRLPVLFLLAVSSACRISELETLQRRSVNQETGEILLRQTKNKRTRIARTHGIALDALLDFLRDQPAHVSGYLFAGPTGAPVAPRAAWEAARKAAGVLDTGWHTARHTSLTWYASLGATETELREHGGHLTLTSLAGYIHAASQVRSDVAPTLLPEPAAVRIARQNQATG